MVCLSALSAVRFSENTKNQRKIKKVMKRIFFVSLLIVLMFSSCHRSRENKINDLIAERMDKNLYHPESYEGVETEIDSAFSPFDSPEFYEKTSKFIKVGREILQYEAEAKSAKSSMAIWGDSHSAFGKNNYNEAKEKHDRAISKIEVASQKANDLVEELKEDALREPVFIGFKARHRYRTKTDAGQTVFGEMKFLLNKDLTEVIAEYDMDGNEYKSVRQVYEMMVGAE